MSHASLRRHRENMGYGALSGLFRDSPAQPRYSYSRNRQRLREWQQSNASASDSMCDRVKTSLFTALASCAHLCLYHLTPKLHTLKARCKSLTRHIDAASLCVILFALCTLFVIILSRFIVDYEDVRAASASAAEHLEPVAVPSIPNIAMNSDITIEERDAVVLQREVVAELDPIDDLFRPAPVPIPIPAEDEQREVDALSPTLQMNEWVLAHSVDWLRVSVGQIMKLKDAKGEQFSTVRVESIDLDTMTLSVAHVGRCWLFCSERIDVITDDRLLYLIDARAPHSDTDTETEITTQPTEDSTSEEDHEIVSEPETDFDLDSDFDDESHDDLADDRLSDAIERIHSDHDELRDWVEAQMQRISQETHDTADDRERDAATTTQALTSYLDDKMSQMMHILEAQQNAITSITQSINAQSSEAAQHHNTSEALHWDRNYWDAIEDSLDDKIESAVKAQLASKFDGLATQIAEQIAKEMEHHNPYVNEDIIRPDSDGNHQGDQQGSPGNQESPVNELESELGNDVDWAYRVVSHSKLKHPRSRKGLLSSLGHWLMQSIFTRWNQRAISVTQKPGDCTPLHFEPVTEEHRAGNHAYITIELYRAIRVKAVSLFHYRSPILTQRAIDAAPRDFQIWGSADKDRWYDLGNFSYVNEATAAHTQRFEVAMGKESKEEVDGDVVKNETNVANGAGELEVEGLAQWKAGFRFIAFRLLSNYGGGDYGCIYRLKVFGDAV